MLLSVVFIKIIIRVGDRAAIKTGKPLQVHLQNVNNNNNNNNNSYRMFIIIIREQHTRKP